MNASECFQAGDLQAAITAMNAEVKQNPADINRRGFLCELLCFAGNFERADQQLDLMGTQDPQAMVGVALFRHLIRAEQARQQLHTDGRVPEFLTQPSPRIQLHLQASICLRENKPAEALQLLNQAEEQRPHLTGTCNGQPFEDLRDLDDLTASIFEVLTSNGKYYWIPMEDVELIELRPPARPRDLLWTRAHMVVHGGPDGEVYLPTLYAGSQKENDDRIRLGRLTDWKGGNGAPMQGVGQRTFLVGNEGHPILQLQALTIDRTGS